MRWLMLLAEATTVLAFSSPTSIRRSNTAEHASTSPLWLFASATALPEQHAPKVEEPRRSYQQQHSMALASLLQNGGMDIPTFFQTTWQRQPFLFRASASIAATTTSNHDIDTDSSWNATDMRDHPLETAVRQGWHLLTDLLEQPTMTSTKSDNPQQQHEPPLVIHDGHVQHPHEWMPAYRTTSLYAPYLNGSSVMQAHADGLSPWLAALCNDFQKTFPYVYANTYLTPPQSRALNVHADDRDVLVVQLVGSKQWIVWQEIPIALPYTHEQVGKRDELPVPPYVTNGRVAVNCTLNAGDVLYIPRGHCHEARCATSDDLSFHVTIAVATFDWTLAAVVNRASQQLLMEHDEFRKGLLPSLEGLADNFDETSSVMLQDQIDSALQVLRQSITLEFVLADLQARIQPHRQRAAHYRAQPLERIMARTAQAPQASALPVGPLAARHLTFHNSRIRTATAEEHEQCRQLYTSENFRPILAQRPELSNDVQLLLQHLQSNPTAVCSVSQLSVLLEQVHQQQGTTSSPVWCDLAWLGFAKIAVEAGLLAVVQGEAE